MSSCNNCGFAYALTPSTQAEGGNSIPIPVEITVEARGSGGLRRWGYQGSRAHCLRLQPEIGNGQDFSKGHDCTEFRSYVPGFSAKEHYEMALDEQRETIAITRHKEILTESRKTHNRELLIFGVGVTLVVIIVTVIGAAIEASWIPKWFGI